MRPRLQASSLGHRSRTRRRAVSLLVRDRCPRDDAWSRGRIHARGRGNLVGGNSRDLSYALERKLVDTGTKLFKSRRPLGYEVLIVETFVDDNLKPTHAHRRIGASPQWEPYVRKLGILAAARVQHDQLCATLLSGAHRIINRRPAMFSRVMAEQHDAFAFRIVGIRKPAVDHPFDRRSIASPYPTSTHQFRLTPHHHTAH